MTHTDLLRDVAAAKLEALLNLPDQARGSITQGREAKDVVDAIAELTIQMLKQGRIIAPPPPAA